MASILPSGHDQYFTTVKAKYLTGLVSIVTASVCTAGAAKSSDASYSGEGTGAAGKLSCDASMEVKAANGTTYYIPLFTIGATS